MTSPEAARRLWADLDRHRWAFKRSGKTCAVDYADRQVRTSPLCSLPSFVFVCPNLTPPPWRIGRAALAGRLDSYDRGVTRWSSIFLDHASTATPRSTCRCASSRRGTAPGRRRARCMSSVGSPPAPARAPTLEMGSNPPPRFLHPGRAASYLSFYPFEEGADRTGDTIRPGLCLLLVSASGLVSFRLVSYPCAFERSRLEQLVLKLKLACCIIWFGSC